MSNTKRLGGTCQRHMKPQPCEDCMAEGAKKTFKQMPNSLEALKRKKAIYIGAPACFALEQACQTIRQSFGNYGIYLVGSCLERPDWRDVDVRYIMADDEFAKLFPTAGSHWENDPRWLLLTVSISQWLAKRTGLPVDFQFQPQTHANERHKGPRSALGLRIVE